MPDSLVETVVSAIAEVKRLPRERVSLDSTFAELGMDSLDTLTLLFELESRLRIAVPDEAAKSVRTVRDIVEGIRGLTAGAATSPP
ncbi:MAG TPA: acyl carrier protein [Thermoanaerobaculia bacterium]|nr:acyl carrier protein [Thermoanaerobaculia bacterium]